MLVFKLANTLQDLLPMGDTNSVDAGEIFEWNSVGSDLVRLHFLETFLGPFDREDYSLRK
jgi:hypothetical protein